MMQVVLELILGFLLCMYAGLTVPGNFHSIHPSSEENRSTSLSVALLGHCFEYKILSPSVSVSIHVFTFYNLICCVSNVKIVIRYCEITPIVEQNCSFFVAAAVVLGGLYHF